MIKKTKAICIFLPGILKIPPFGAFFIIIQKLQVTQEFWNMIWKPNKIPLPVIGVTSMYCKNWLSNGYNMAVIVKKEKKVSQSDRNK